MEINSVRWNESPTFYTHRLDRAIDAAVETYEQLDKTVLQPTAEFLENTVLSLDATQAALGVALADADKGVANARAELDKALAAAEASYESLAAGPKALAADAEKAVANSALIKNSRDRRDAFNPIHWLICTGRRSYVRARQGRRRASEDCRRS